MASAQLKVLLGTNAARSSLEERAAVIESPRLLPLPFDRDRLDRFESYVARFRQVFHRSDQFQRFRAYLRGILEVSDRKNVESIAAAAGAVMAVEANLAQSLQHFVTQSPWDHRRLISSLRKQTAKHRRDPDAVWVVHEGAFAKKGKHSVGVQRQFARSLGRKINCQLGVFVVQVGPKGYHPLGARLYLPGHWLRENQDTAGKLIPEEDRQPATKIQIALHLLEEIRAEGEIAAIAVEGGYLSSQDWVESLTRKGFHLDSTATRYAEEAVSRFEWLKADFGLDHFEGRTWHGWHHHVGLVFAAYQFLASELEPHSDRIDPSDHFCNSNDQC